MGTEKAQGQIQCSLEGTIEPGAEILALEPEALTGAISVNLNNTWVF